MVRVLGLALTALLVFAAVATADIACDDLGVGINFGMLQPSGGEEDYEDSGMSIGITVKKPLAGNIWGAFEYTHGVSANGEAVPVPPGGLMQGFGSADEFKTVWNKAQFSAMYLLMPEGKFIPYVSAGLGLTFWEVQDWREDADEEGVIPDGYNEDGNSTKLNGTNLTASIGLGADVFVTERLAVTLGGRYSLLIGSDVDNVGLSSVEGADWVDANNSMIEAFVGLTYYFGPGDCDGDGIIGKDDECWNVPEDFDGFEDEDGCPEPDNDMDGILDEDDECPNDPEDFDGDNDEDGCPDIDMDGDGIMDMDDACPEEPEDIDGFEDEDGCPDVDNDGDGVLDPLDMCPNTPKGVKVDEKGCEIKVKPPATAAANIYPVGVLFPLNSKTLSADVKGKLDEMVVILTDNPELLAEVSGYACDLGADDYNQTLSESRAQMVIDYLGGHGVDAERFIMKAFGETRPEFPNTNEVNRQKNRRVVITPVNPPEE
ncbi:OmpA family protein [bacterium]|nr:OmpA family protein [bacterium]